MSEEIADAGEPEILVRRAGAVGGIRLNRPRALNSLSLAMVRGIAAQLDAFAGDPAVEIVLIDGAGERAFCAGGDIRAIHRSGGDGDGLAATFWREEYRLNARIAHYPKPYVALMDGITMGGGVGLSAHGSHRVVTERTRLAMPEAGIGFVPDVGGTWLLAHAPGETGTYMALTGTAIGGADAIDAGLADVVVPSARLDDLRAALAELAPGHGADRLLGAFAVPALPGPLRQHRALIDRCFAADTVEAIVAALERESDPFAAAAVAMLRANSPTSVKLALRLVRLARGSARLEECLLREYRAACHLMAGHDLFEGVRAAVIDKDRRPRWRPERLEAVDEHALAALLAPVAGEPDFSSADAAP